MSWVDEVHFDLFIDIEHDTAFLDESGEHSQADNSSVADDQQHSIQAESFDYYLNPTLNDKPSPPPQQHHLSGSANGIVNENTKLKTENNAYARRVGDLENQVQIDSSEHSLSDCCRMIEFVQL